MSEIKLSLIYDGLGPVFWTGGPELFGVQDRGEALGPGRSIADGTLIFDLSLQVTGAPPKPPVLSGAFAHGPPGDRFLYLSWSNREGHYAQRLKLPLSPIGWDLIAAAQAENRPLVATLEDKAPKATKTGANIGGTRPVTWRLAAKP